MKQISHWINGAEYKGSGSRFGEVFDPALGTQAGQVSFAEEADIEVAVSPAWKDTSLAKRNSILFTFRQLLDQRKGELAAIITEEHGKVLSDAMGEINRGLEVVDFACGLPHLLKGEYSENASTSIDVYSMKQPLGVVGIISPFNFPAMVPMWFFPVAIAAGNTVVVKPSEKDPSSAMWIAKLLNGVFNVLHGDKVAVDGLLNHPLVKSISFVGSTPIAQYIYETSAKNGKRVQALGGAKNHMLVLPDADLDLVADSAVNAGFGSAGERCMAISVVVAVEPVADSLIAKIKERMLTIKVGDGRRACDMGPLVTKQHRDKVASYIDIAKNDGAVVVVDGRDVNPDGDKNGFWLGPTLIDKVPTSSKVYKDEIFGPVLSIVRVKTYEEGLKLINSSEFGNGTAIFTNDGGAARRFQHEVEVGMIGINVPIPVPVAYFSFGGWKHSLFGDSRAHGEEGFRFFTQTKVITSRWLDPSHGGINLGFPQN
ncbi:MAG: hypothetical protein RL044_487 [Actinomycetota bacterium]